MGERERIAASLDVMAAKVRGGHYLNDWVGGRNPWDVPSRPPTIPPVDPPTRPPSRPPPPSVGLVAPVLDEPGEPHIHLEPGGGLPLEHVIQQAIENWMGAPHLIIGIHGKHHDGIRFGHKYGVHDEMLRVTLKGMTGDAEIRGVTLYGSHGFNDRLEFWDLRIATPQGSRAPVQDIAASGSLVFKRCGLLPDADNLNAYGGAGMKWGFDLGDGTDYLHIEDCYRAEIPQGGMARFQEHWAYLKATGAVYLIRNDMRGGNRTGVQFRSPSYKRRPKGPILIEDNNLLDYDAGWEVRSGGKGISVWENPDHTTEIRGNKISTKNYGCILIGWQPPDQGTHTNRSGHAHGKVWIHDNECEAHARTNVSVNAAADVTLGPGIYDGQVVVDNKTEQEWGAPKCGRVDTGDVDVVTWEDGEFVPYG